MRWAIGVWLTGVLAACASPPPPPASPPAVREVVEAKDLEGVGYAVVHSQPGKTPEQQRLAAIRAARVAAMRDLAEQVYGSRVSSDTTLREMRVQDDQLRTSVEGVVRGATTVRINPVSGDTYEVVLRISARDVAQLMRPGPSS